MAGKGITLLGNVSSHGNLVVRLHGVWKRQTWFRADQG